jgi:hypothetical protein
LVANAGGKIGGRSQWFSTIWAKQIKRGLKLGFRPRFYLVMAAN